MITEGQGQKRQRRAATHVGLRAARGATHHDRSHASGHRSLCPEASQYPDTASVSVLGLGAQRRTNGRVGLHHGLLATLLALIGACSDVAGPERSMSGKQIYERQCARCHGIDGTPTKASPTARDLTNRTYIDSLGDKQIRAAIMQGRPLMAAPGQERTMPAFGNQFSSPELEVLVGYMRSLSNPELGPDEWVPEVVRERVSE